MAMMENQGKEVQTCLLTHTVRSEMQMAELATTSGCQDYCRKVENAPQSKR